MYLSGDLTLVYKGSPLYSIKSLDSGHLILYNGLRVSI